ncbi:MAG: hypothetical protein LDL31_13610, partial [Prosthecobacter sp.]|nr:hypothetical protein [Prosthecobacter sp.]
AEIRLIGVDNLRPGLAITAPAVPGMTVSTTSPYLVTGTAGDVGGIDRVEVVLNGGAPVRAVLGSSVVPTAVPWSLSITPRVGLTTLMVSAYDLAGNFISVVRSFTFIQRQALAVRRVGPSGVPLDLVGQVNVASTPAATTALPLVPHASPRDYAVLPGRPVRLQALPRPGYLFSHWAAMPTGATVAGPVLSFTMPAQDVAAEAVFVVNPLLSTTGACNVFAGLLRPQTGTPTSNATYGHVTATLVPATGTLSGRVTIHGVSQPFSALVLGSGGVQFLPTYTPTLLFSAGSRSLTLTFSGGNFQAQVSAGALVSTGTLARAAHSAANPLPAALLNDRLPATAPVANRAYLTIALPSKAQSPALPLSSYPQGDGHASLVLDPHGTATLVGVLADGTGITASTVVVEGGVLPVFARLRTPGTTVDNAITLAQSSLSGLLQLDTTQANSDITGSDLTWFRPAVVQRVVGNPAEISATQRYTAGWPQGIVVDAVGALYDRSRSVQASLGLSAPHPVNGNAEILMTQGKLVFDNEIRALNIVGNVVEKIPATNPEFTLVPVPNTGFFSGTFTPNWTSPNPRVKPAYRGIILQKGSSKGGYGFFFSNRVNDLDPESGRVTLGAP